tara:strand:- start:423 stop:635 length:213 start_codon:yes stop_codon:yes gene_type:complete
MDNRDIKYTKDVKLGMTDLPNKHDRDPHWEKQSIKDRIDYLEKELAARNRQDGWTIEGLEKELHKLKNKI